jgi:hypothetical protein
VHCICVGSLVERYIRTRKAIQSPSAKTGGLFSFYRLPIQITGAIKRRIIDDKMLDVLKLKNGILKMSD